MALPEIRGWKGVFGPSATRVFAYLKPEQRWLWVIAGLAIIYIPLSLVEPYLMIYLIDKVLMAQRLDLLPQLATRVLPFFILFTSVDFLLAYTVLHIARNLQSGIRLVQLDNLLRKSLSFFNDSTAGKLLYAFFNDSGQIGSFLSLGLVSTSLQLLFAIARLIILAYIDRTLVLVSLVVVPLQALVMYRVMKIAMRLEIDLKKRDEDLTSRIEEMLRGTLVVKAFGFTSPLASIWMKMFDSRIGVDFKNMIWRQAGSTVVANLQLIGLSMILFIGAYKVSSGDLTLGSLLAFTTVSGRVTPSIQTIIAFLVTSQETFVNIERYYRIYDYPDENGEFEKSVVTSVPTGRLELTADSLDRIRIHDVRVDHGGGRTIFIPCEFEMRRGESCLWHGPNGSGKTSLALALAGLVAHRTGSILIGDEPLASYSLKSVREHILYVGTEPFWPERTLAENFENSRNEGRLDDERLARVMRISSADDVLASLPKRMQTVLSSDAHMLSRGENQRLFLAMALYREPTVLVLDESLSHVSERNLAQIMERLGEIQADRLIVHVSHRRRHFDNCEGEVAFRSLGRS